MQNNDSEQVARVAELMDRAIAGTAGRTLGISGRANATWTREDCPPGFLNWVEEQLARFTYKPGWTFRLYGDTVAIRFSTEDTYRPGSTITVGSAFPLYPLHSFVGRDPDRFALTLARHIWELEVHESREWLRRDGEIFDNPHASDPR